MKYSVFLLFILLILFQHGTNAQTVDWAQYFRTLNLTAEQKELVEIKIKELGKTTKPLTLMEKVNVYAYSIMNDEQKALYKNNWLTNLKQRYTSDYQYLHISDDQVNRLIAMQLQDENADTLMLIKSYSMLPRESLLPMLDSVQLSLETQHQKEALQHLQVIIARSDSLKVEEAANEEQRLALTKTYYTKYLQRANRKVVRKISGISPKDGLKIDSLAQLYRNRIAQDKVFEISLCYSADSILRAPNTKKLKEFKFERYTLRPNLCLYWCRFGISNTLEAQLEQDKIVEGMEYFKINYPSIIEKALKRIKKPREKLITAIEATYPKRKGTVVTIEAEERIQHVQDVSEILLTQ